MKTINYLDREVESGTLYFNDGEKFMELEIPSSENVLEFELSGNENPFTYSTSGEITIDNCDINPELIEQFIGIKKDNPIYIVESDFTYAIRIKKHKKYRIDKKWWKQYGVKLKTIRIIADMTSFNTDNGECKIEYRPESAYEIAKHYYDYKLYEYAKECNVPIIED